ncbi:HK97 family phage prohead protease [Methylobacterium mesophilicum]|uniref:HK97 family phage prohead protease n=1 Tax=Methylobacterium mesophilicum TaxID=39956 RepID=UPI0002C60628|nr:HK97 family phage prohead protease [Methylobacterium mesophilicum]
MASKNVSIDEYLNSRGYGGVERKQFARDSGVIIKAAPSGLAKARYDKEARTMRFVMSAEVEDRDRDIVVQAGLNTSEFEKNPVAPWSHRAGDPPVGTWSDLEKSLGGRPKRTEGTLTLVKGDVMADRLDVHFQAGSIRACSIGFMPLSIERREVPDDQQGGYFFPGYMIHEAELYECSPCCVPANPAALAKAAAEGDVLARETIEHVLDTWTLEKGVIVPRKAFEDAHQQSGSERKTFVMGGERFVAFKDAAGDPKTTHKRCPGRNAGVKADWIKAITARMGELHPGGCQCGAHDKVA